MFVNINPHTGVPLYLQISDEIRHLIAIGGLQPGERLPRVRELGAELGVNPNTVKAAYSLLVREGLVDSRQGRGALVAPVRGGRGRKVKMEQAAQTLEEALVKVLQWGVSMDALEQLCKDKLDELRQAKGEAREAVEAV